MSTDGEHVSTSTLTQQPALIAIIHVWCVDRFTRRVKFSSVEEMRFQRAKSPAAHAAEEGGHEP